MSFSDGWDPGESFTGQTPQLAGTWAMNRLANGHPLPRTWTQDALDAFDNSVQG